MQVHRTLNDLPDFRRSVITIGSFDGVHFGHQQIVHRVKALALETAGESVVITFHPHPRQVIYPQDQSLQILTPIDEKIRLMEALGIDHLVIVPFTVAFSQISADEYIENFLVNRFKPRYIVIGYDHRFGLNRQGDIRYLKWHGEKFGYEVVEIEKREVDHIAVSSTKVRDALLKGSILEANNWLNHYYTLLGKVVGGKQIGRQIGFPTANLQAIDKFQLIPADGIYAVLVCVGQARYQGMMYIGVRPTVDQSSKRSIEVNIFDFEENIYDEILRVELVAFIRQDARFPDLESLSRQLESDREQSLLVLSQLNGGQRFFKPPPPRVAVVILNYNGRQHLETFLPSILMTTYGDWHLVVADNGSTDGSIDWLKVHYPDIRIIDLKQNYGYAEGYNQALKQMNADYCILLNSDVAVTPGWIEPMVQLLESDPLIGAVQPKILAYKQADHFEYAGAAGGWMDTLGYPFCRGRVFAKVESDNGQYDDNSEIFWASGAALVVRTHLFRNSGGFDGDYFAHSEEIDWCWRIKRAGYKIMVAPAAVIYHLGGGTLDYLSAKKVYLNFRNGLFTLVKNETAARLWWLIPFRLVLDGLAGGLFLAQGKPSHVWAILQAHGSFYKNFPALWKKRKAVKNKVTHCRVGPDNVDAGRYKGSVAWQYFALGKKYFSDL